MVSLMSKGFFLFLFILPDFLRCDEIDFIEDAQGNRFYLGHIQEGERLPEKKRMKRNSRQSLPESFDARDQWPECKSIISLIRRQKQCGSCWAFTAVEIISDRICIKSKGNKKVVISPEDLMTCCKDIGCDGCQGGDTATALKYWKNNGIVTGGDFNSSVGCRPYTDHWSETSSPSCNKKCEEGYPLAYDADKHYGLKVYSVKADVKQIQQEIYENGPVSASLEIYDGFGSYESGVYSHPIAPTNESHAVKIIGWGVEDDTPYWLCVNSWGTGFGDKGFIKILRGDTENNCGIETRVAAGIPKL